MKKYIYYESVMDFLQAMIENEGKHFIDLYGRRWKYEKFKFYYADINSPMIEGLKCLHLYGTGIKIA